MLQYLVGAVTVLLVLSAAELVALAYLCARRFKREVERKTEAAAEEAMNEKDRAFDEGFESIMRFSVNGKTGFERE